MPVDSNSEHILKLIFDYVAKASQAENANALITVLADMGRALIESERCTIWIWDRMEQQLWTKFAHGVDRLMIPENTGLVGYAVHNNEELIINNPYNDERFNKNVDKETSFVTKAVLIIPIINSSHEIVGAYQALNKYDPVTQTYDGEFTQKEIEYMRLAATYTGNALESALLTEEIEKTQVEIIRLLADVGESRSKETGNHVNRVKGYCVRLAQQMKLANNDLYLLEASSPLHDLGKVGIPDSILNKPGMLTDEEREIIKTHTTIGYDLLCSSKRRLMCAAAIIAHQHHERYDGKGYPNGLAGDEIHIYGRIAAVADVFDALIIERCYKPAWPLERVKALMLEERGKQFCPKVIDAFFACLDDILKIRNEFFDTCQ